MPQVEFASQHACSLAPHWSWVGAPPCQLRRFLKASVKHGRSFCCSLLGTLFNSFYPRVTSLGCFVMTPGQCQSFFFGADGNRVRGRRELWVDGQLLSPGQGVDFRVLHQKCHRCGSDLAMTSVCYYRSVFVASPWQWGNQEAGGHATVE